MDKAQKSKVSWKVWYTILLGLAVLCGACHWKYTQFPGSFECMFWLTDAILIRSAVSGSMSDTWLIILSIGFTSWAWSESIRSYWILFLFPQLWSLPHEACYTSVKSLYSFTYISNFSKIYFITLTAGLGKIWSWRIGFPSRIWLVFESQWPHPLGSWIRIWIWITGRVIKWIKRNSCIKYKEAQKQTSRL